MGGCPVTFKNINVLFLTCKICSLEKKKKKYLKYTDIRIIGRSDSESWSGMNTVPGKLCKIKGCKKMIEVEL